jgi:hypothetical protein
MNYLYYVCEYCGVVDYKGHPHFDNIIICCLDCAYENKKITKNEYIINMFYDIMLNNLENYDVVLKGSTNYKQYCCIVNSKYEVVDLRKNIDEIKRNSVEYNNWRNSVFIRDDYICQHCKQKSGMLNAHHIKSYKDYPELRLILDNGITLCYDCHKKEHKRLRGNNYG